MDEPQKPTEEDQTEELRGEHVSPAGAPDAVTSAPADDDGAAAEAAHAAPDEAGDTEPPEKDVAKEELQPPMPEDSAPATPDTPKRPRLRRRLTTKARLVALLLIVVLAGGGLGYWHLTASQRQPVVPVSSFRAKTKPFKLVSTIPGNNATDVNTASHITLNFSQPISARKLMNNVFITPQVNGTFEQGSSPNQVVFVPKQALTQGVKYSVMVNATLQSTQGTQLGVPVAYGFTTSIPGNSVDFSDQGEFIDNVTSLASGAKETYTLLFGGKVSPTVTVTLYKGGTNALLSSLVYSTTTTDGYPEQEFSDLAVSTSGLTKVSATPNLKDQSTYTVQQPDGLYVAVATDSSGKEVGFVWVDISNFGVMLRQDDQKTVLDAQSFATDEDVPAETTFYNLNGSVTQLGRQTVDGLATAKIGFDQGLDMAVATYNGETAVVPVNVLDSGGDIRVDQNLSTAQAVYGITDKPSYKAGNTINFAGYMRLDDDAQYVNPGTGSIKLYVGQYKGDSSPVATKTVSVDAHGMFSGSLQAAGSWLSGSDAFDQFQLYAASVSGNPNNDLPVASFTVAKSTNQSNTIHVSFTKAAYLPGDKITAGIQAVNASGQPLANASVQVHIFSQDYYENDLAANQQNFGDVGSELPGSPVTVKLDASGQGAYTVSPSSLPGDGNSQRVTVRANIPGQTGVGAAGGDTAIVHQGDGFITFGPTRRQIPAGADLTSEVYLSGLNGTPMANTSVQYTLFNSDKSRQLASGTVATDTTGYGAVSISASKLTSKGGMVLVATAKDRYGNTILSQAYFSVVDASSEQWDTSGASLFDLNIRGTSGNVQVGDTVHLTISAPAALRVMVTMDRGRIYNPSMLNLQQGDNSYSFTVTPELAPSFTLTFSYFQNGVYHSEGVAFNVSDANDQASVSIQTPATITAGQSATLQLASTDSAGDGLPVTFIVGIASANSYGLTNQVNPDIFSSFYASRPIMTSSSSSLSLVGSGGGRCGGGGPGLPGFANAVGTVAYWRPGMQTSSDGRASVTFTPPKGSWRITVYAMSDDTKVGSQTATFTAN